MLFVPGNPLAERFFHKPTWIELRRLVVVSMNCSACCVFPKASGKREHLSDNWVNRFLSPARIFFDRDQIFVARKLLGDLKKFADRRHDTIGVAAGNVRSFRRLSEITHQALEQRLYFFNLLEVAFAKDATVGDARRKHENSEAEDERPYPSALRADDGSSFPHEFASGGPLPTGRPESQFPDGGYAHWTNLEKYSTKHSSPFRTLLGSSDPCLRQFARRTRVSCGTRLDRLVVLGWFFMYYLASKGTELCVIDEISNCSRLGRGCLIRLRTWENDRPFAAHISRSSAGTGRIARTA